MIVDEEIHPRLSAVQFQRSRLAVQADVIPQRYAVLIGFGNEFSRRIIMIQRCYAGSNLSHSSSEGIIRIFARDNAVDADPYQPVVLIVHEGSDAVRKNIPVRIIKIGMPGSADKTVGSVGISGISGIGCRD